MSGMRHLLLIVGAFAIAGVGVLILVLSRCASTVAVSAGSGFVLLSLVLAIPAQMLQAKDTLAAIAAAIKGALAQRDHPCP